VPLRSATAKSLKKAFRERLIARYGVPKANMGISQQFTAPYTPQENPTELANRTVKTMIAQFACPAMLKLGREVAEDYAISEHEQIRIHRPYTGVSYPGQGTASTQQPI